MTTFRSEQHGNIEVGVVEHEGRAFSALGCVLTPERVTAYLGKSGVVTNWHGTPIGTYRITSTWKTPSSYVSSEMHQVYATINGITYTGRSCGEGMIFNGKATKG